jgi:hypothetical protein
MNLWDQSQNIQHFGTGPLLRGTGHDCMGPVLPEHIHLTNIRLLSQEYDSCHRIIILVTGLKIMSQ